MSLYVIPWVLHVDFEMNEAKVLFPELLTASHTVFSIHGSISWYQAVYILYKTVESLALA